MFKLRQGVWSAAAGVLEWSEAKRKNEAIAEARNTPVLRSKMPEKKLNKMRDAVMFD